VKFVKNSVELGRGGERPISVAVVEDDAPTRTALAAAIAADASLSLSGTYSKAGEALAAVACATPDVLLVDLGLPDMSGLELIRAVATQYPSVDVLVFTAFGDEATVVACLEAGARGYLLKGSGVSHIGFDVREIRSGGSPLSPQIARHLVKRLRPATPQLSGPRPSTSDALSPRELEVLNAISRGFTYAETAALLGLQPGTVHAHLKNIYRKLEVRSNTEAVFEANRLGLLK
jgi:DNA-binding NarL/FixJ family response regulator